MAVTINGVLCEELVNDFEETVQLQGGPGAVKGFLCDWADRFRVAVGFLGLSSTTRIGGFITLETPHQYPEIPTLYAHSIRIQGAGPPFQGPNNIAFPKAKIYVDYQIMPWSFQPFDSPFNQLDPTSPFVFAEQRLSSSAEFFTIPGKNAKFKTSGKPIDHNVGFRLCLIEMEITLKFLPYMPSPTVLAQSGTINNALYLGVNTGSLIFNGVTTTQTAVSDGTFTQSGVYSFTARSLRWDYDYDGANNRFDQVVRTDGSTPFLTQTDFTQIIPVGYQY